MKRTLLILAGMLVASMIAFVACDDEDTQQAANEQFCDDTAELLASLRVIRDLDADSTIEEVDDARERARNAYENVLESLAGLAEADVDALQAAYDDLQSEIAQIDGGTSVGDALEQVDDAIEEFAKQAALILNDVDCSGLEDFESQSDE